jgi:sortase A
MKKLAYGFILAGIVLLLFPTIREFYYDREQQQLMDDIELFAPANNSSESSASRIKSSYEMLSQILTDSASNSTEEPTPTPTAMNQKWDGKAIAIIEIDKIDLTMPILDGATNENMKVGAAHMKETAQLGEIGNAAVAAHRARTKGRQFNRLNEVEIGDKIVIRTKDASFTYNVNKISVVEPTDLSVLESNNEDAVLTLITCEPMVNPTHRLIVHAEKIQS